MKDFADPLRTLDRLPFEVVQGEIDRLLNPMGLPRPPPSACAARYCTQPAAAPSWLATRSSIDPTRSVPTSACWPRITGRGRVALGRVQRARHLLSLVGAHGERVLLFSPRVGPVIPDHCNASRHEARSLKLEPALFGVPSSSDWRGDRRAGRCGRRVDGHEQRGARQV